eukprot:3288003-Pyramimonas_sp.AAC.1
MGGFIDDLIQVFIVPEGSTENALLLDCVDNTVLNRELELGGFVQNISKQDALVRLRAPQATRSAERQLSGRPVTDLIHL